MVFLVYYNVIFARGTEKFLELAAESGVSGLVIPDLPIDELGEFGELVEAKDVALCPLAAPTSTDDRIAEIGAATSGFVYCVSVAGVTGARESLSPGAVELLRRVRSMVDAPVALGFGISSAEAAAQAAGEADGVIIGSKLMQLVAENGPRKAGEWLDGVRETILEGDRAGVGERH